MHPASHHIGYLLKQVQHELRLQMDGALRALALTTPQYSTLSKLDEQPGVSGAALARACFVTPQTMNEILMGLERAGLVARERHPTHGRIILARLTEHGSTVLREAHTVVFAIEDYMLAALADEAREQMAAMLTSCAQQLAMGQSE